MPRMIKADCPECKLTDSLTIAFGDPYQDFGDGLDDSALRVEVKEQECRCDLDDTAQVYDTIRRWISDTYPYAIKGEW